MSLLSETQELLDDSGIFWVDEQVYDGLNNAMLELWPEINHDVYSDNVVATASQDTFTHPSRIMIPKRITGRGGWKTIATWGDMERIDHDGS